MPTATTQPFLPTIKPLKGGITDLENLYKSGGLRRTYGPRRTAGLNASLSGAWDATEQRARDGNPLLGQSQDYVSQVLSGDFLDRRAPGFDAVLGRTRDLVNANASAGSRYGSGVHQGALARELGGLEYENYLNERGMMHDAAGLAPELAAADYFDLDRLTEVGGARQGYDQMLASEDAAMHAFNEGAPEDAIMRYLAALSGVGGLGSVNYAPKGQQPQTNPWLMSAGIGADLAGSFLGNPGSLDFLGGLF